jgi:very-short-patch-repair endonuclease
MPIKFKMSDNSPENRRRMVAASGAYQIPLSDSKPKREYANSQVASIPITKTAQYAGSAASVVFTQPMFFSPMHTPQNWQIASKRREAYQWCRFYYCNEPKVAAGVDFYCFTPDSMVLMSDGTEKPIKDVVEGDMVVSADGTFRKVLKTHKRHVEEELLRIKVGGFNREIKVTMGHEIPKVPQEEWIKSSLTTPSKRRKRERISKFGDIELKSIYTEASNIEIGDRLFTPSSKIGSGYDGISNDICYVLGAFAAEGSYYWYTNKNKDKKPKGLRFSINENEINSFGEKIINILESNYDKEIKIYSQSNENCVDLVLFDTVLAKMFYSIIGNGCKSKKISEEFINKANKEQLLSFMGGYIDGDGCFDSHHGCQIRTASDILFSQISFIIEKLGLSFSVFKDKPRIMKLPNDCFSKEEIYSYNVRISRRDCSVFNGYSVCYKELEAHHAKYREFLGLNDKIYRAVVSVSNYFYQGDVHDLTIDEDHSYIVHRVAVHNSVFPMNGFKLECPNKKILKYYERLVERLELAEMLNQISHEYFLIGDVFPFLEIECEICGGRGYTENGEVCVHPDGTFKDIKVMNPDYMDVQTNPLADSPEYYLIPDEDLKMIIQRREPKKIFDNLPPELIALVASGMPIPLSSRCISHLKHNPSPYGAFGNPLLQRLFTVLAYKTKLMTANWIVAERLILPVRVVKVGEEKRPATDDDLNNVVSQLSAVANDPNLTIVTHHAFDYEWFGAEGKIVNITPEIEQIGKEILDGLMLNQALLNGEMTSYSSAQVGVEVLIRRLDNWRNKLKGWVEKHIFLPAAMMQGFVDEKESEELGITVYLHPQLIWNDLQLRDKTSKIQSMMQLYDKGIVSAQSILEELNLDYDSEIEKIRDEQVAASASGMLPGGGGDVGTMGMGGGMGGAPGGMPGGDMAGGMPGGDMAGGMAPGGEMGGGMAGGAPMAAGSAPMISKRGKGTSPEDQEVAPPQMIKLTKLEQKMYKMLKGMNIPYPLFAQYSVKVPGEERPFMIDFAYPKIGVGVETDGSIWHERDDFVQRDKVRDQKLAGVGWRILRFKEGAVDEHVDAIGDIIYKNVVEAAKDMKKRAESETLNKYASVEEFLSLSDKNNIGINIIKLQGGLGELILIGNINE